MAKKIISSFLVAVMLLSILPFSVIGAEETNNQSWRKQTLFDEFESGKELDRTFPWNLGGSATGSSSYSQLVKDPQPEADGDKAVRLKSSSGFAASQASFDCNVSEANAYTTDMTVSTGLLADKSTDITFKIFGTEKTTKRESELFNIKDGKVFVNSNGEFVDIGAEIPLSKWCELYVLIELEAKTFSIAVNGETLVTEEGDEAFPLPYVYKTVYKVGFYSKGANSLAYLDDFYFTTVEAPEGEEAVGGTSQKSKSSLDKWENNIDVINSVLKDRLVMAEGSPKFFNNMVVGHYAEGDYSVYPVLRNDAYHIVPARSVAENLGLSYSFNEESGVLTLSKDGKTTTMTVGSTDVTIGGEKVQAGAAPEIVNGTLYVPANEIALAAGKKIYVDVDNITLIIIGATAKPFNSRKKNDLKEEIARATYYERPDADRVMADIKANPRASQHPRIMITKDRIAEIKEQIKTDPFMKETYEIVKKEAQQYLKKPLPEYNDNYGGTGGGERYWYNYFEHFMLVYWMEGFDEYLERSIEVAMKLCELPHYGPIQSLSEAEAAYSLAIAYDWMYDYLTPEQRQTIKDSLVEKIMRSDLLKYQDLHPDEGNVNKTGWTDWGNNFTTHGNEGVILSIAAMWDQEPELCEQMLRYFFRSMETAFVEISPDGGGREGVGYLLGGTVSQSILSFRMLVELAGTDYNYLTAPQFKKALENAINMYGSGGVFRYADNNRGAVNDLPQSFWVGKYMSPMLYENRARILADYPDDITACVVDLIDYDANYHPVYEYPEKGIVYRKAEAGTFRNSWHPYFNTFVGFKGGDSVMSHSHRDLGSFVFQTDGVPWFDDHGMIFFLYSNSGYTGNQAYNHRAEGHNVLMFRSVEDLTVPPEPDEEGMIPLEFFDMEDIPIGGTPSWGVTVKDGGKLEVVEEDGNKVLLMSTPSTGTGMSRMQYSFTEGKNLIKGGFSLEYDMKINHIESDAARVVAVYTFEGDTYETTDVRGFRGIQNASREAYDGYRYEKETWFHVKTVYDTDAGTCSLWVDGKKIYEDKASMLASGHCVAIVQFETGAQDIEYMIDNLKFSLESNEHNFASVVANMKNKDDQSLSAVSKIQNFTNGEGAGFATADLSAVYPNYTKDYKRAFGLFQNREVLVLRDEATVLKDCETWWFGHTVTDITLSEDGKSAILTEAESGKRLWVGIMTDGPEKFTTMPVQPFPESPNIPKEVAESMFAGKEKLTIMNNRKAGEKIELTIMMTPLYKGETAPSKLPEVKPIAEWEDEPYTGARLPDLLVDGVPLDGFDPAQRYYEQVYTRYDIDPPLASIPQVSVPEGVNAVITQAQSVGDTATITVGEGEDARTYYVVFDEKVEIYIDPASIPVFDPPYEPTGKILNAGDYMIAQDATRRSFRFDTVTSVFQIDYWFDGDIDTNHSVAPLAAYEEDVVAFEDIDLGEVVPVSALEMVFANGEKRRDIFSLYASVDGENWEIILSENMSSGKSRDFERFSFPTINTRWLRIVSHGNSGGSRFCNLSELRIRK